MKKFVETMEAKCMADTAMISIDGIKPIDWHDVVKRGKEGSLTSNQANDYLRMASFWVTCACGNLCSALPRNTVDGGPLDEELNGLGIQFYKAIGDRNWKLAERLLGLIERRSFHILFDMGIVDENGVETPKAKDIKD